MVSKNDDTSCSVPQGEWNKWNTRNKIGKPFSGPTPNRTHSGALSCSTCPQLSTLSTPSTGGQSGQAYACELYATALASNGELSDAENFYRDAKGRLKGEISEAERLLDCIDKNLACIKDAKDNAESE